VSATPDDEFCRHHGNSKKDDTRQIENDKGCTTILPSFDWKTPYIAQPDRAAGSSHYDAQFRGKTSS